MPVQALHLRNTVTNDDGGTAVPTAWTLSATGAGGSPTNLSGKTPVDSGAGFKADTYTLAQTGGPSGYTAGPWSCVLTGTSTSVAVSSNKVVVGSGKDVTCTINNNDDKKSSPPPPSNPPPSSPPPPPPPPAVADVAVQKLATARVRLGSNGKATIIYSLRVQNNGPADAAGVVLVDVAPRGVTFSAVTLQPAPNSCVIQSAGTMLNCSFGTMTAGSSLGISVNAIATATGTVTNTAFVTTSTPESNGANNNASARTVVIGTLRPATVNSKPKPLAKICRAVTVAPKMLKANGKLQTLRIRVTKGSKGVAGTKLQITGAGIKKTVKSGKKGWVVAKVQATKAGIIKVAILGNKACASQRVGVVGSYEPPVTG